MINILICQVLIHVIDDFRLEAKRSMPKILYEVARVLAFRAQQILWHANFKLRAKVCDQFRLKLADLHSVEIILRFENSLPCPVKLFKRCDWQIAALNELILTGYIDFNCFKQFSQLQFAQLAIVDVTTPVPLVTSIESVDNSKHNHQAERQTSYDNKQQNHGTHPDPRGLAILPLDQIFVLLKVTAIFICKTKRLSNIFLKLLYLAHHALLLLLDGKFAWHIRRRHSPRNL